MEKIRNEYTQDSHWISDHQVLCLAGSFLSCLSLKNFTNKAPLFLSFMEKLYFLMETFSFFLLYRAQMSAGFSLGDVYAGVHFLHKNSTHTYCNVNMNIYLLTMLINKVLVWNSNLHYTFKVVHVKSFNRIILWWKGY